MFIQYHNMDISFLMGQTHFRVLNIAAEQLERIIPSHRHGEGSYEIHYNASGCGQVRIGDSIHDLVPNSLYLVGPHISHAQIPDPANPQLDYCIYLQLSGTENSSDDSIARQFGRQTFWIGQDSQNILSLLEALFSELAQRRPGHTVWVESLLRQLVVCMTRNYGYSETESKTFEPATPEEARAFIIEEAFLYEYPWLTLESLSDRLGLGVRQTQRLLKQRYSKTFQQKRNEARMSAASILLTHTRRSVASIAEELGYSTAEHFTTAFKNTYLLSATEYRRRFTSLSGGPEPVLDPPEGLRSADVAKRER